MHPDTDRDKQVHRDGANNCDYCSLTKEQGIFH